MRTHLLASLLTLLVLAACTHEASVPATPPPGETAREVEAACGTCKFDLPGSDCALAVRIDGHAYFVDGTSLDDHGDAHAADGFCNAVRTARVSGNLVGERFVASSFELLPAAR